MITCALTLDEIKTLHADIVSNMNELGQEFDPNSYMQNLYNYFKEEGWEKERAAQFIQAVPQLILVSKIKQFKTIKLDLNALNDLNEEFFAENGIETIINTYEKKENLSEIRQNLKEAEMIETEGTLEVSTPVEPSTEEAIIDERQRFKSSNAFTGTLQIFERVDPKTKDVSVIESIDSEFEQVQKVFDKLSDAMSYQKDLTKFIYNTPDGRKIELKVLAKNFDDFVTTQYYKKLPNAVRAEVGRSRALAKQGLTPKDVVNTKQRVILVVSDKNGNPIFFDSDGNVSANPDDGIMAFQFLRVVRKEANKYTVRDIYNKEDQIKIDSNTIADIAKDKGIGYREAADLAYAEQQKDFETLFKFQQKALKEEVVIPFNGMTEGVASTFNTINIPLNQIERYFGVSKSVYSSIDPHTLDGQVGVGKSTITIGTKKYEIDRMNITPEITNQIVEILAEPSIPYSTKKQFVNSYIPFNIVKSVKRHNIFFDDNNGIIKIYTYVKTGQQDLIDHFDIKGSDIVKYEGSKKVPATFEEMKQGLSKALNEGFHGKPTKINYDSERLKANNYYTYDPTSKKVQLKEGYLDLIGSSNAIVKVINAPEGFYNKQISFSLPETLEEEQVVQPKTYRELKNDLYQRLTNGETITGEIQKKFTKGTTYEFITDGQVYEFFNKAENITPDDLIMSATLAPVILEINGAKVEAVEVRTLFDKPIGYIRESSDEEFAERKKARVASTGQIIDQVIKPTEAQPTNDQSTVSKIIKDLDDDILAGLDRKGLLDEDVSIDKVKEANRWWNSPELKPLRDTVSIEQMANIVNSNVYATFFLNAANIVNGKNLGVIKYNPAKGNMFENLTIYHEAWHVFTQLFLSPKDKIALYESVKNYKNEKGNQPYKDFSYLEVEELLAEDFRTFMKDSKPKVTTPIKTSLFRRILNFFKSLFGKNFEALNEPVGQFVDVMNVPMVNELYNKLRLGNINDYTPLIDNSMFLQLDRGIEQVKHKNQIALSVPDSQQVVSTIDNIFAEILDNLYQLRKSKGLDNLASANIVMLTDPEKRAWMYNKTHAVLKEKLAEEQSKLKSIEGAKKFSDIKTLDELEANSVAVIKTEKGNDKYFFLASQVEDYNNLSAAYKNGDRVQGEEYHGVKIIGDFYKHETIKKNKKPVDIIIVSNIQDIEIQYDNYKKAGNKTFKSLEVKSDITNYKISDEEQQVRNNIRILQATLNNFGDETSGVVKYHVKNTAFEILKKKYDVNDTEEVLEEDETTDLDGAEKEAEVFSDDKFGKKSMQELASKETTYILKSLFKIDKEGKYSYDRFGFKERADFSKVYSTVAKTIGGIKDRKEAYEKLKEESKNFPELRQLVESKLPDPTTITNEYAFDISTQFFLDFSLSNIKYYNLAFFSEDGKTYDARVNRSSLDISGTLGSWEARFKSQETTDFVSKTTSNNNFLNTREVVNKFKDKYGALEPSKQLEFANAIGIFLEDTEGVKSELTDNSKYYGLPYIFEVVKDFAKLQELSQNPETFKKLSKKQVETLNDFLFNPIGTLNKKIEKGILPNLNKEIYEKTQLKRLAELQSKYGYEVGNTGVLTPEGNVVFEVSNHSAVVAKVSALNDLTNLQQAWTDRRYKHLSYLNPNLNPYTKRLKIFRTLFDENGNKIPGKSLELYNMAGSTLDDEGGVSTTKLDALGKMIQEFHTMLIGGRQELPRHAEKNQAFGLKIEGGITPDIAEGNIVKGPDTNLYIDVSMFFPTMGEAPTGETFAIENHLLYYLAGEFDRIKAFRGGNKDEYLKVTQFNKKVGQNPDGTPIYAGQVFTAFDDLLSPETKAKMYELAESGNDIVLEEYLKTDASLKEDIINDIKNYFRDRIDKQYTDFQKFSYVAPHLLEKAGIKKDFYDKNKTKVEKTLIKAWLYNSWIHNFEVGIFTYGDFANYDHVKEHFNKRIPGSTSDGKGFVSDEYAEKFINEVFNNPEKYKTYASSRGYQTLTISDTYNAAVIAEPEKVSVYIDEMVEAWREDYSKTYSPDIVEKLIKLDVKAYKEMNESDGIAYMSFDAYRSFKKLQNNWSLAQESLYQKIIEGKEVSPREVSEYFPIYKLHYYGAIGNSPIPANAMHKFSVMPLIPTIAKPGTELYKLHEKMVKENIHYVTFGSGSKAADLTSNRKHDNAFTDDTQRFFKEDVNFTVNNLYFAYLKEVTSINNHLKGELPIASQTRVIILDNLFNNGDLINKDNEPLVNEYNKSVVDYSELLDEEFLTEIGYDSETGSFNGDLTKFVDVLRSNLEAQKVPDHLIKLINTDLNNQLTLDLSLHPESDSIEKMISSKVFSQTIKQKTKGEPLVQAPSTFFNGLWDSSFKTLTEEEDIRKFLGTNNLPFYRRTKGGKTKLMKVAVPITVGDFRHLLKAKDLDGNEIGTIDRLNELIKDDAWLDANDGLNRKSISIFGPRIPNDATNTIEGAEVWHFIDGAAGNTIIVPTELVAKAGSDFDGDKLFFTMPNINSDGTYVSKGFDNYKDMLAKAKENDKLPREKRNPEIPSAIKVLQTQKKYLQNKLITDSLEILTLPENYAYLTRPNQTYLVSDIANRIRKESESGTGYNKYENSNSTENKFSPTRVLENQYLNQVHDSNLSLKSSLGIQAKATKNHVMFKLLGARLPESYNYSTWIKDVGLVETDLKIPIKLRFKHNTIKNTRGNTVISMAGNTTQSGARITDINSHSLNGILDRAKDAFPFDLQQVPEAINVINHLLETGVDENIVFDFITTPLIKKFISLQRLNNSPVINLVKTGEKKPIDMLLSEYLITLNNTDKVEAQQLGSLIGEARKKKLKAISEQFAETILDITVSDGRGRKSKRTVLGGELTKIPNVLFVSLKEGDRTVTLYTAEDGNVSKKSKFASNTILPYITDVLSDKYLNLKNGNIDYSIIKEVKNTEDVYSLKALALLMNYLDIENNIKGWGKFQMKFSFDTSKITTIQQAERLTGSVEELLVDSKNDKDFVNEAFNNSYMKAFDKSRIFKILSNEFFTLKNNPKVKEFINNSLNTFETGQLIKKRYKTEDYFINKYNGAVKSYLYQNYMSHYVSSDGQLSLLPESLDNREFIVNNESPYLVQITDKNYIVNLDLMKKQFDSKSYYTDTTNDTFEKKDDPFKTFSEYVRYTIERERAKAKFPQELVTKSDKFKKLFAQTKDKTQAYNMYVSELALINSFNRAYIFGTTKYSYAQTVLEVIQDYPMIKDQFQIIKKIELAKIKSPEKILTLSDRKIVKGQLADTYAIELKQLGDRSIQKLSDPSENNRVSGIFNLFSLMMFYQHGADRSTFSFTKALNPEKFIEITNFAAKNFAGNEKNLPFIFSALLAKKAFNDYYIDINQSSELIPTGVKPVENYINDEFEETFDISTGETIEETEKTDLMDTNTFTTPTQPTVEPIKQFKNSLFRGQEREPVIDSNGDLVLVTTYDSLFKSEGVSFAEDEDMAKGYGLRYSKNPYIIEIDADYADTIFPLDTEGGTKSYGKRVIGDEGEQRFISKENIVIPKGKYKITREERTFNFETFTPEALIEAYNKQFYENDIAEYNRYGEISTGYATEGSDYYDAVEKELLRRGISKNDLPFLITPDALAPIEEIVGNAYNIKPEPGELLPNVSEKQIQEFLNKQSNLKDILQRGKSTRQINESGKQAIRNVYENTVNNKNNIYNQLGNKTKSENVVIKSWGELKDATVAITNEGIIATRIKNTEEHFGNPFSHDPAGKTQGLIKTETIKEAVEKYIDWVINGANFEKKNLFTVKPIQNVDKKATVKASIATQYIGFGEGITNSSTELYRQQAGKLANTGNYSEKDTIFVSVGGRRGTEQQQKEQQDRTIKEALKAIENGAILITDNKSYVESNSYNTGEKRLAQNLIAKGYNYIEKIIDGQVLGVWFKGELNPLRAEWIREQLKLGELKNRPILYYKELGEPSHATALDYLINKYNWNNTESQNDVEKIENPYGLNDLEIPDTGETC